MLFPGARKKLHLSTYISITITFLVITSTLITSGILYFSLSKSLTSEFEERIKAEGSEVMQVLANQFHRTDNRLRELSLDNTIRVTLMLGVFQQLQEHFSKKYSSLKDLHFFLSPVNSEKIFNASGLEMTPEKLKNILVSPASRGRLARDERHGFIYSVSQPIFRQKSQIGTAAGIYILGEDATLEEFVRKNKNSTLIKIEGDRAWNLISGKPVLNFTPLKGGYIAADLSYFTLNQEPIAIVKSKEFPGLLYISKLDRLSHAKHKVFTLVLYSSLAVLILTIFISLFLSRLLGTPLSQLSIKSLEMAAGKSHNLKKNTISSNVIEIDQLMISLSTMVESLKKTEELKRYQQLFEGVADPLFICKFSGKFLEINQIAIDQFGLSKDEFQHMVLADIIPESHHKKILNIMEVLSQKSEHIIFETEILTKDNKHIYVECHARKIIFKDQEVVLSVLRDITDRKKAEENLIRSEERLSLALEVSLADAWEFNCKTKKFTVNTKQLQFLGYPEIGGQKRISDILKFIDEDDRDRAKSKLMDFLNGKNPEYRDEFQITTQGGEKRWIHNRARVIQWDSDHKPMVIIGTAIDISGLKKAEKALRENEERYRTILNNRNIGYFEIDVNGDLTFFNDAVCNLMGYGHGELLGMNFKSYTDEVTSQKIQDQYKHVLESGRPLGKFAYTLIKKDGTGRMVETSVSLIKDSGGVPLGFRGLIMDITEMKTAEQEKKKLESELRQSHKMEAIGTLAGGIAHDFNNILSGIFGYSQLAEMNIQNPAKIKGYLSQIIKGAKRAAGLVQQILTFSRQTEHEKQILDISIVVKEALKLLRSSIPTTIEIKENIISHAKVMVDPTQIHQIIINLCTNAYHAMRTTGGSLTVELNEIELSAQDITDPNILPGEYIKLEIRDTGHGMDEKTLSKVFDPYFTTKKIGDGTGLGLSLVYGIVEDHKGYVKAQSVPGQGSSFQVFLPALDKNVTFKIQEIEANLLRGGSERIMIVDDEESIMISTRELLSDYGYQVSVFSNGIEAMEAFKKRPDRFDLIITDMTMPQMTGAELSAGILKIRRDQPIVLCTGYSENISEKRARAMGIAKFLQKPIESKKLILLIRELLDE